jgi:hypothetical protein
MKKVILIYIILMFTSVTFSQTEKQLVPSDLKQRTIVTEPATLSKGFFRAGLIYGYGVTDKLFDNEGKKNYLEYNYWGSSSGFSLSFEYGISDRLMVNLNVPYTNNLQVVYNRVLVPEINTNAVYSSSTRARGIGDCGLTIKYQLVAEKENKASLTGTFILTVPTGKKNFTDIKSATEFKLPTGNGYLATLFKLNYRKIRYPYSYEGYVSYNYKFKGSRLMASTDETEAEFKDGNSLNIAGVFSFHLNEWIALKNAVDFFHNGKNIVESMPLYNIDPQWVLSYQPILVFQIKKFRIGEGFMIPVMGKNASANPQVVLLTQYVF